MLKRFPNLWPLDCTWNETTPKSYNPFLCLLGKPLKPSDLCMEKFKWDVVVKPDVESWSLVQVFPHPISVGFLPRSVRVALAQLRKARAASAGESCQHSLPWQLSPQYATITHPWIMIHLSCLIRRAKSLPDRNLCRCGDHRSMLTE